MLTRTKHTVPVAMALAAVFAPGPQAAEAQEEAPEQECTVEVAPARVQVGQPAVAVTARLSADVGEIQNLESEEGGLALATPEDLQRTEMARTAEGEAPEPVTMSSEGREAALWLNTEGVEAGTHAFTLAGENGVCSGQIEVVEAGERPGDEGR